MGKRFNPDAFLEIAREIKDLKALNEEGRYRTLISRAYYACFLIARSVCERKGGKFHEKKQHVGVRDYLKALDQDYLANLLKTLFDYRVNADYILNATFTRDLCDLCIDLSEDIIEGVEEI